MRTAHKARRVLGLNSVVERARNISTVNALRAAWIVAVAWYELGLFFWSVAHCAWPDQAFTYADGVGMTEGLHMPTAHILLIADPQLLDGHSYQERGHLLSLLTQLVVDLNMRKSWWAARRLLLRRHNEVNDKDTVIFLGDMLDNGRNAYNDAEYADYYNRFKSVFTADPSTMQYYIPGNHDIGLGASRMFSPQSRSRYIKHFGPLNFEVSLVNHTLVMLDAPGLVEEDYRRSSAGQSFEDWTPPAGGVVDFVNKFASVGTNEPVVLFSHIPLFRPDTASCGPLRERGTIRRGVGFGYQNTLGRQTSNYLLQNVRPSAIFSGDDHDYCEYTHSIPLVSEGPEPKIEYVREVTVKSFSMAMGIRNPGFQLLSLAHPASLVPGSLSHADTPCILPDQIAIYLGRYLPLVILSLCVLAVSTFRRLQKRQSRRWPYTLDIDSGDGSSIQMSPESTFGGPLSATRMPHSAGPRSAGLAPTYRASSATFPSTPYAPNLTVSPAYSTPTSRVATPGLLSAPPAGLAAIPGDVEYRYGPHEGYDEDDEAQYAERRVHNGTYFEPFLDPATPRRRFAWSWTFVLGRRRRRITIGVPPLLEQAAVKIWYFYRQGDNRERLGDRMGRKDGHYTVGRENAMGIFINGLLGTAWPPILVFALINCYMFR